MTGGAEQRELLLISQAPRRLRVGASWVVIGQWAEAAAAELGTSRILTSDGEISLADARALATVTSAGPEDVSWLRRRIPEVPVTLAKDLRSALRARTAKIDLAAVSDSATPFVWQHHSLFQASGAAAAEHLDVPLVIAVEALQTREARSWGVDRPGWSAALEHLGEARVLRRANLVTVVSEVLAEQVATIADPARIIVTPNRVDIERYAAVDRAAARSDLGLTDEFAIGWVGSFRSFHGLETLMAGFRLLLDAAPTAVLVLVGDGPERAACERFADAVGGDRVRLTGMIPYGDVPRLIGAFDAAVIPSLAQSGYHYSPLKLQEYLAAGVAVVGPDVGQVAEILGSDSGLLYPPGDGDALGAHLCALAHDERLRRSIAAAGRARVEALPTTRDDLRRVMERLGV